MAESSEVHAGAEAPDGQAGLPQFESHWWGGEAVWLLIVFAIVFALISTVFSPNLRKAINKRSSQIGEDLANARALRDEAEAQRHAAHAEIAAARTVAQKTAADAKAKAMAEATTRQLEEDAKLNARLELAQERITQSRTEALSHVNAIAAETAAAVIEKLAGVAAQDSAIEAALGAVAAHA